MFFEERPRRSLPRRSRLWILVGLGAIAGGAAVVVLLTRDSPPREPAPVSIARAERRLERQLGTAEGGPQGSVHCPSPIRPDRATRCEFLYRNGDTQLMLVTLRAGGELDIDVPYPAQRRAGGR